MERYQLILAYDGTQFFGFQRQGSVRTVQAEVETALRQLGWQDRAILSAGRTDTGVHAAGQVIAFDLEWQHPLEELQRALNAHLPRDIAVQAVCVADARFHPRYDAQSRCYHYHLRFANTRHPLFDRFTWQVWPPCAPDLLAEAAQRLTGVHDYRAFGAPTRPGGSTTRAVYTSRWQPLEDGRWRYEVVGNAFLYHMVRRMVNAQVLVGQGRLSLQALEAAVETGADLPPGMAPPHGLVLQEVRYIEVCDTAING